MMTNLNDYENISPKNDNNKKEQKKNNNNKNKEKYNVAKTTVKKTIVPDKVETEKEVKTEEKKIIAKPIESTVNNKTEEKSKRTGKVNVNLLNVRKGPGIKYEKIASYPLLKRGKEVDICDFISGTNGEEWYYIGIKEDKNYEYGYVKSTFITLD